MCKVAVCEGDDGGHVRTRNRMSECHDMVCERRDTQVCVGGMETKTASDKGQGPSSGRSCFGDRAGFARQARAGSVLCFARGCRVRACASEIRSGNARGGCKPIPWTDRS